MRGIAMNSPVRTSDPSLRALGILLRVAVFFVITLGASIGALIAWAAGSDLVFRGCWDITRDQWATTANCTDAWFAHVLFGGVTVVCLIAVVFLWRWRH